MIGFYCINKRTGDTSAYCVNKVKRRFKVKCGHMGTLDPLASGVLPVAVGQATRLFDLLLEKEKSYDAVFDFAYDTPSFDLETEPLNHSEKIPTEDEIMAVLPKMIGEIMQVPPAYSAKCVDGTRSYKLARHGKAVELPPKKITIYSIELLGRESESAFRFKIVCSGGTYIRSIARDLAKNLGCFATMTSLVRTSSGPFTILNSITCQQLEDADAEKYLIKPQDVLNFPVVVLNEKQAKRMVDGLFDEYDLADGLYKVFSGQEFWGVGIVNNRLLKMKVYVRDL